MVALGLIIAAAGCSRCGEKKGATLVEVTRWVPQTAELAVVVPDLGVLGERIQRLQSMKLASFAAQLQGFPDANAFADALIRQAGVDLRSREAMRKAGLAPERGLAAAILPDQTMYAVVGVSDAKAFHDTLANLARNRLGAAQEQRTKVGGHEHVLFSRRPREGGGAGDAGTKGVPAELGYVRVGDHALIAAGAHAERLPEVAKLTPGSSLANDSVLKATLSRMPDRRDLYLHAPKNLLAKRRPELASFTATVSLEEDALRIFVDMPWPGAEQTLNALAPKPGAELLTRLPSDAFAVARFNGDPTALEAVWPGLVGPHLQRAFTESGLDVSKEVLANLEPGLVASLSVSPQIPLGAGMPELDVRRTNPFRYAHLVAFAKAKDGSKVGPLMARMPEVAPRFGARIEPVAREGAPLYVTRYAQGEGVHFAQAKGEDLVVLGSPLARVEQVLTAVEGGEKPAGPPLLGEAALKDALTKGGIGLVVDLDQLRESVKALPSQAWGIGGFAIKASAVRWLDATDDLRALTVSVTRKEGAVQADIALRFTKR